MTEHSKKVRREIHCLSEVSNRLTAIWDELGRSLTAKTPEKEKRWFGALDWCSGVGIEILHAMQERAFPAEKPLDNTLALRGAMKLVYQLMRSIVATVGQKGRKPPEGSLFSEAYEELEKLHLDLDYSLGEIADRQRTERG